MSPVYDDPYDSGSGTGGGTTGSICSISPSDNISTLGNLISRVADIEKFLSRLVGADVHADNLSELATNLGNVLNGTVMLSGSQYSPYGPGGSIPVPEGFTGSFLSGNVLTIWENGVVRYEVQPSQGGVTTGGGGISDYLTCRPSTTVLSSNRPAIDDVISSFGTAFDISDLDIGRINFNESGYYHIDVHLDCAYSAAASNKKMTVSLVPTVLSVVDNCDFNSGTDTSNRNVLSASFGFEATAGQWIAIEFVGVTALSGTFYDDSIVTIEKLRSL